MKKSLSLKNIDSIDKSGMLGLLLDFPLQLEAAVDLARRAKILFEKRDFNKIVFAGVGGSAIGADIVKTYLYSESKLPITVCREYVLPAYVDNSTLVFVSSYSGNTEEIISAYAQGKKNGASLIVISSGGILKRYAQEDSVTFIPLPPGLPPRCALGYSSIIPLCILAKLGLIHDVDTFISQTAQVLKELRDTSLNPRIGQIDNVAKYIAAKLINKMAVIYSSSLHFEAAATRLRGQLNENAKSLALSHVFPEMSHNEISGWQNPKTVLKNVVVLMLRDKAMHLKTNKRMSITKEMLQKEGVKVLEIWSRGQDLLSRIFSLVYIGDFISFYLSILYGIDPAPTEKITYVKEQLAKG